MAANEYKRDRIYYTKAQIQDGLITNGEEWMFVDGTEYIGQYHRYTTNEVFSEATFVDGKSRKLIPYVDIEAVGSENVDGIDFTKNYLYDNIKTLDIKKTAKSNPDRNPITDKDIKNGYVDRYFGYRYDNQCIELNKEKYNKIGSEEGLTDVLYSKVKLKWKISGPVYDVLDSNGKLIEPGVFDTNKRTVALYSEKYPSLKLKLLDYLEYYQP